MSDASPSPPPDPPPAVLPAGAALDSSILSVLMDTVPDRIYFKDLQSRFVRVNRAYAAWHGFASPDAVVGKTDHDLFAPIHADVARFEEQHIIRTGQPLIAKMEKLTLKNGGVAWGSATKLAWRDASGRIIGTFGLTRDATAVKLAEEKLTEERNLLRTIIDHLPSRIYVKDTTSHYLLNNQAHLDVLGAPNQEATVGRTTLDFFPGERGRQALQDDRQVLSSGTPILNNEKSDFGPGGQTHWSLTTKVPLRDIHGKISGIVGISHDITRRKLIEQELQRRAAEVEADVLMARQVQETFLPQDYPRFPRGVPLEASALRFAHRYIPATTLGGDFFDIVQLSDTQCGVLICDVMGHGLRAGLLTALIRGVVGELGERANDPAHVLAEINLSLAPIVEHTGQPVFASAFFGVIDTAAGTLVYSNAGHPPPLLVRSSSDTVIRLVPADPEPAAGLIADFHYTRHESTFDPGDLFLGYTDGVLEAADVSGEFYGEKRLSELLLRCRGRSGDEVCEKLVGELEDYSGGAAFDDDVCIVAMESTGTTCTIPTATYEI